jgi:hypothetical protein
MICRDPKLFARALVAIDSSKFNAVTLQYNSGLELIVDYSQTPEHNLNR